MLNVEPTLGAPKYHSAITLIAVDGRYIVFPKHLRLYSSFSHGLRVFFNNISAR